MADRPLKVQDCLPSTEPDRILLITASVQHGARKRDFQNLVDWKPPAVGPIDRERTNLARAGHPHHDIDILLMGAAVMVGTHRANGAFTCKNRLRRAHI